MWPNNYGVWADEFESLGLYDCLDKIWPMASIFIDDEKTKYFDRAYGRVNRKGLKLKFLSHCASNGVKFNKAKALKVNHEEFESSIVCDDGTMLKASLIVDASGYTTNFLEYDKPRNNGLQIAHDILAEVDSHPFDLDKMHLMDWRDSHLSNEPDLRASNSKLPTFLYAMPFDSNFVFLEETALVNRPILSYTELKNRMVARLRHLGIQVRSVIEDEKCVIPMGGPLPKIPQSLMAIGGNSGLVHPANGIPWLGHWRLPLSLPREFYNFGMETLLQLDLDGIRRFFDAFFKIDAYYYRGFMSSNLSIRELFVMGISLFWRASNDAKMDMATKSSTNMARMMGNMALEAIVRLK
ncbi:hypothetical protein DH2020_000431 [Rehmannia glutinosa]|uniref:Lycopene beta-cyclase n=1 Tax=Rehmannia glutinosa TaxID=99300 RepID=A0ABR0XWH4_REHGL